MPSIACEYCHINDTSPIIRICDCHSYHYPCLISAIKHNLPEKCDQCNITYNISHFTTNSIQNKSHFTRNLCIKALCTIFLTFGFTLSVIGWNINNITDPRSTLVQTYKICNNTAYICEDYRCDTQCEFFFHKNDYTNYILIILILYWMGFILGLLSFITSQQTINHIIKRSFIYFLTSIPINTLLHFIGSAIIYLINKPVHKAMPIITLYTIYIGATTVPILFTYSYLIYISYRSCSKLYNSKSSTDYRLLP